MGHAVDFDGANGTLGPPSGRDTAPVRPMRAWYVMQSKDGTLHVMPSGEPHECDGCWCLPHNDDGVMVHHTEGEVRAQIANTGVWKKIDPWATATS